MDSKRDARAERALHLMGLASGDSEPAVPAAPSQGGTGDYEPLRELGEGAFGVVWEAQQTRPVRRRVALKILKGGRATREVLRRFEAEKQALARMDHPGIARVFDAGSTPDGLPFVAMELVDGAPITEHCERLGPAVEDKIRLLLQVCDAASHAHSKGVIHRDIKPSNILVDAGGRAKLIDFGIARAVEEPLVDTLAGTRDGQVVGTLAYMSPEQAASRGAEVDVRSDVYSLAAVLYELLTGSAPLGVRSTGTTDLETKLRALREAAPPRPSALIAPSGAGIHPRLLRRVRGELDWILLRGLEKDPARRYPTPADFAADLRRFLAHEAVEARSPSAAYRLAKFARRHRVPLAAAGAVAAALVAATLVSLGSARRARAAERQTAEANRQLARENYLATIRLADHRASSPDHAHLVPGMLRATDPTLRGWEYGWLLAQNPAGPLPVRVSERPLNDVVTAADGRVAYCLDDCGSVVAWDLAGGAPLWRNPPRGGPHRRGRLLLGPRGGALLASDYGAAPRFDLALLGAADGTERWRIEAGLPPEFAFGPGGTFFANVPGGGLARRSLTEPEKPGAQLPYSGSAVSSDRDGRWLAAAAGGSAPPRLYDADTLAPLAHPRAPDLGLVMTGSATLAGPGPLVASAHASTLVVQNGASGEADAFELPSEIHSIAPALAGDGVFLAGQDWIGGWMPGADEPATRPVDALLTAACDLPDGGALGVDGEGLLHRFAPPATAGERDRRIGLGFDQPESRHVLFTPDGERVAWIPWHRGEIWLAPAQPTIVGDTAEGIRGYTIGSTGRKSRWPCFDPATGWLLVNRGRDLVWLELGPAPEPVERRRVALPAEPITVAFAPGSSTLLVSWAGGAALIEGGDDTLKTLPSALAGINDFSWAPDGGTALAAHPDRVLIHFEPATGRVLKTLPFRADSVEFHPGGTACVVHAYADARITAIDLGSAAAFFHAPGPRPDPTRWAPFVFSPDGTRLLTFGSDSYSRLRDWPSGEELIRLGQAVVPSAASFSPDGTTIAIAGITPAVTLREAAPWSH